MFRSFMHGQDMSDPKAIPNYLEQHFKEKVKMKKQKEMMGESTDDLQSKIDEMESINTAGRKLVNVKEFQKRKERLKEEYI
jgi:hypothetical protein